jgi:hypothetical protein
VTYEDENPDPGLEQAHDCVNCVKPVHGIRFHWKGHKTIIKKIKIVNTRAESVNAL